MELFKNTEDVVRLFGRQFFPKLSVVEFKFPSKLFKK